MALSGSTTKEFTVPTMTEADRTTKNGNARGAAEGIAEGIAGSFEGLAAIARTQAEETFKQGEKAERVLRDQAVASIRAVEDLGLSVLSTIGEVAAPLLPKLPGIVPAGNLDLLVKSGFDIAEQMLSTERKLTEAAVAIVVGQAA